MAADLGHSVAGRVLESAYLVVGEALLEHGKEALHVLDELGACGVRERPHCHDSLLVHRCTAACKHLRRGRP